jgi:hypothetical protein
MFKSSTARVRLFTQFKLERRSSLLFCKSYQELINNSPSMSTVRIIFFRIIPLRSVPSFGICSSAELGMPRNEYFVPRNNGIRSESIPRNFLERNSVPNPMYSTNPELCSVPWTHQPALYCMTLKAWDRIHESTLSLGILRREFKRNWA